MTRQAGISGDSRGAPGFAHRIVAFQGAFGTGYPAVVQGIANLLAYWRFSTTSAIVDIIGGRNGTYDGAVAAAAGLPTDSDQAVRLGGLVRGTVPTHASFDIAAFTLSFWVILHEDTEALLAILAREQSGLFEGDFGLYYEAGQVFAQFQTSSVQNRAFAAFTPEIPHHVVVTADGSGFSLWIDGQLQDTNTSFTGAWTSNGNDLIFGSAQQLTEELDITIDECAIYSRVLTTAEIVALSQNTAPPIAASISGLTVDEGGAVVTIDVAADSTFIGLKSSLTVEIWNGSSWTSTRTISGAGTATVQASKDIDFTSVSVSADVPTSFDYRITDANGVSNTATISLTVINSATVNPGGGTLVYQWAPLASWIDGVALSSRDANDVIALTRWTNASAATVGATLPKAIEATGGQQRFCFNRAPTGHPSLEINTRDGEHYPLGMIVRLYDKMQGTPRHLRVVVEVKTCKTGDATTYKADGMGTTGGSYPNWLNTTGVGTTADPHTSGKYMIAQVGGQNQRGACAANWWNDHTFPIDQAYFSTQWGTSSKIIKPYIYYFSRPAGCGGGSELGGTVGINTSGILGEWHRLELEIKLTTPALVPTDARRSATTHVRPTGGDGYARIYITPNIDAGTPGSRALIQDYGGMIYFCRFDDTAQNLDNMHELCNLYGPFLYLYYGGGTPAQAEGWAWIRKLQVYRHD